MDSRQLSYFKAVVDHGSFTHAAEAMDMTQPSLSLSIRKLEKELDAQLLHRGRSGVSTTEAGAYLYKVADKLDNLFSEASRRVAEISSGRAGSITVNSAPEFNWAFMPEVINRLHQQAPEVTLHLEDPSPDITIERVLDGSIDVGLIPSTDPRAFAHRYQEELEVTVAAEFPFLLAIPTALSHLPDPVSLTDVADQTWLLPPRVPTFIGLAELMDTFWAAHPETVPSNIHHISTLQTAVPLVDGGIGVSLLPDSARGRLGESIQLRSIKEPLPPMQALLIYRKDRDHSPAVRHFIDIVTTMSKP